MNEFTVYKSSLDGISSSQRCTLEQACHEICFSKGWDSIEQLRDAIRRWGAKANPGDAFTTAASVIVCVGTQGLVGDECPECLSEAIEYEDLTLVKGQPD